MSYPALSNEKLDELRAIDATGGQYRKANEKAKEDFKEMQASQCLKVLGPNPKVKELRLLMLGKTGAGKSATSNLIIGGDGFEESAQSTSCTEVIRHQSATIDGIKVSVIDTPGFNDTKATAEHVIKSMQQVVEHYKDGIHGILFLFNMGNPRFTEEEQQTFKQIQQGDTLLGRGFMDNCFLILSHGKDILKEKTVKEYIDTEVRGGTLFGNLINNVFGRRAAVVDNSETTEYGRQLQREQVVRLVANQSPKPFLPELFKKFLDEQKRLAEEMPEKYLQQMKKVEKELAEARKREAEAGGKTNEVFGMLQSLQMQLKVANENADRANENAARAERHAEMMLRQQDIVPEKKGCTIS